jgi:hypothetical protein
MESIKEEALQEMEGSYVDQNLAKFDNVNDDYFIKRGTINHDGAGDGGVN